MAVLVSIMVIEMNYPTAMHINEWDQLSNFENPLRRFAIFFDVASQLVSFCLRGCGLALADLLIELNLFCKIEIRESVFCFVSLSTLHRCELPDGPIT